MQEFDKQYEDKESEVRRFKIWLSSKASIEEHNKDAHLHGYTQGMNQFSDFTHEEYAAICCGCLDCGGEVISNYLASYFLHKLELNNMLYSSLQDDDFDFSQEGEDVPPKDS